MKCHYEILQIPQTASSEDIRRAYKKLALKWHPDKNPDNAEANEQFLLVQQAYELLSDPHERAWYDKRREEILAGHSKDSYQDNSLDLYQYFNPGSFHGYDDNEKGFYTIYRYVFDKIAEEETLFDPTFKAPTFGNSNSSYEKVVQPFYSAWQSYMTKKSFLWLNLYDPQTAPNRQCLRMIDKENKKVRDKAKRQRNEEIRALVAFVRKRDPRVKAQIEVMYTKARESKKKMEEYRLKRIREQNKVIQEFKEADWSKFSNVEDELKGIENQYQDDPQSLHDSDSDDAESFYCSACRKYFKSLKQFENHVKSQKHKEKVDKSKIGVKNFKDSSEKHLVLRPGSDAQGTVEKVFSESELIKSTKIDIATAEIQKQSAEKHAVKQSMPAKLKGIFQGVSVIRKSGGCLLDLGLFTGKVNCDSKMSVSSKSGSPQKSSSPQNEFDLDTSKKVNLKNDEVKESKEKKRKKEKKNKEYEEKSQEKKDKGGKVKNSKSKEYFSSEVIQETDAKNFLSQCPENKNVPEIEDLILKNEFHFNQDKGSSPVCKVIESIKTPPSVFSNETAADKLNAGIIVDHGEERDSEPKVSSAKGFPLSLPEHLIILPGQPTSFPSLCLSNSELEEVLTKDDIKNMNPSEKTPSKHRKHSIDCMDSKERNSFKSVETGKTPLSDQELTSKKVSSTIKTLSYDEDVIFSPKSIITPGEGDFYNNHKNKNHLCLVHNRLLTCDFRKNKKDEVNPNNIYLYSNNSSSSSKFSESEGSSSPKDFSSSFYDSSPKSSEESSLCEEYFADSSERKKPKAEKSLEEKYSSSKPDQAKFESNKFVQRWLKSDKCKESKDKLEKTSNDRNNLEPELEKLKVDYCRHTKQRPTLSGPKKCKSEKEKQYIETLVSKKTKPQRYKKNSGSDSSIFESNKNKSYVSDSEEPSGNDFPIADCNKQKKKVHNHSQKTNHESSQACNQKNLEELISNSTNQQEKFSRLCLRTAASGSRECIALFSDRRAPESTPSSQKIKSASKLCNKIPINDIQNQEDSVVFSDYCPSTPKFSLNSSRSSITNEENKNFEITDGLVNFKSEESLFDAKDRADNFKGNFMKLAQSTVHNGASERNEHLRTSCKNYLESQKNSLVTKKDVHRNYAGQDSRENNPKACLERSLSGNKTSQECMIDPQAGQKQSNIFTSLHAHFCERFCNCPAKSQENACKDSFKDSPSCVLKRSGSGSQEQPFSKSSNFIDCGAVIFSGSDTSLGSVQTNFSKKKERKKAKKEKHWKDDKTGRKSRSESRKKLRTGSDCSSGSTIDSFTSEKDHLHAQCDESSSTIADIDSISSLNVLSETDSNECNLDKGRAKCKCKCNYDKGTDKCIKICKCKPKKKVSSKSRSNSRSKSHSQKRKSRFRSKSSSKEESICSRSSSEVKLSLKDGSSSEEESISKVKSSKRKSRSKSLKGKKKSKEKGSDKKIKKDKKSRSKDKRKEKNEGKSEKDDLQLIMESKAFRKARAKYCNFCACDQECWKNCETCLAKLMKAKKDENKRKGLKNKACVSDICSQTLLNCITWRLKNKCQNNYGRSSFSSDGKNPTSDSSANNEVGMGEAETKPVDFEDLVSLTCCQFLGNQMNKCTVSHGNHQTRKTGKVPPVGKDNDKSVWVNQQSCDQKISRKIESHQSIGKKSEDGKKQVLTGKETCDKNGKKSPKLERQSSHEKTKKQAGTRSLLDFEKKEHLKMENKTKDLKGHVKSEHEVLNEKKQMNEKIKSKSPSKKKKSAVEQQFRNESKFSASDFSSSNCSIDSLLNNSSDLKLTDVSKKESKQHSCSLKTLEDDDACCFSDCKKLKKKRKKLLKKASQISSVKSVEQDEPMTKIKQGKKKAKKSNSEVSVISSHCCLVCNCPFESKNKLFDHLRTSGHAAPKTSKNKDTIKTSKKKVK